MQGRTGYCAGCAQSLKYLIGIKGGLSRNTKVTRTRARALLSALQEKPGLNHSNLLPRCCLSVFVAPHVCVNVSINVDILKRYMGLDRNMRERENYSTNNGKAQRQNQNLPLDSSTVSSDSEKNPFLGRSLPR